MENKFITVCDSTLRDGSYGISHTYSKENIAQITAGLANAGVKIIEVGHGDGVGGSSLTFGRAVLFDEEMLKTAVANKGDSEIMIVCLPGIGTMEDVKKAYNLGVKWVRVAVHATESDITKQHITQCKEMGMKVAGMLSTSHILDLEETVMHAKRLENYGSDVVYLADSCGTMFPEEIKCRFEVLKKEIKVPLGFHGHNNLSMAVANTLQALESGATYVDGACRGMGAGAGNTQLEVLIGCMKRKNYETGIDFYKIMDVAEDLVEPILTRPQIINNLALVIGYVGTYGSFLLHSQKAAARYGMDPREIIEEVGRQRLVMGQEDMLIDIAYNINQKKTQQKM